MSRITRTSRRIVIAGTLLALMLGTTLVEPTAALAGFGTSPRATLAGFGSSPRAVVLLRACSHGQHVDDASIVSR
jgi:hypothetical protein